MRSPPPVKSLDAGCNLPQFWNKLCVCVSDCVICMEVLLWYFCIILFLLITVMTKLLPDQMRIVLVHVLERGGWAVCAGVGYWLSWWDHGMTTGICSNTHSNPGLSEDVQQESRAIPVCVYHIAIIHFLFVKVTHSHIKKPNLFHFHSESPP